MIVDDDDSELAERYAMSSTMSDQSVTTVTFIMLMVNLKAYSHCSDVNELSCQFVVLNMFRACSVQFSSVTAM